MSEFPEVRWQNGDDLCDCTYQRLGWWTNPYLNKTIEVRYCCFYKKLGEMFPELAEFMRETEAFDDYTQTDNTRPYSDPYHWEKGLQPWNGETEMPRHLWYRQLAGQTGKDLDTIRREYEHLKPPPGRPASYSIGEPPTRR